MLFVADGCCLLLCLAALVSDVRSYRIPNRLTLGGLALGLVFNTTAGALQLGSGIGAVGGLSAALAGALLLGLVFGALGALGLIGMGDVKLMAAVGAWVRWPLALPVLLYVLLAGGLVAVGWAVAGGRLRAVVANLATVARRAVAFRPDPGAPALQLHRLPYAVAIFFGTAYAVGTRYWSALRLL